MNIPQDIRQYLEDMLQDAGMLTLDDASRESMIQELFVQLDNYIASLIVQNLQPADLEIFIKMNEERKPKEDIEQFIKDRLPNAQELFTNAFIDFRNLYMQNVEASRTDQNKDQ